jgi:SAM-dependent methyltransferase
MHRGYMTIEYYQKNGGEFFESTIDVDMHELHEKLIQYIKPNSKILDAGCGSGRDSKAFLNMGFEVEAFDASSILVSKAKKVTDLDVKLATFDTFTTNNIFDGIWACASLLHVPSNELPNTIEHLAKFLLPNGYWYMSFKYGNSERELNGRRFTDLNENSFKQLIEPLNLFSIEEMWVSKDKRINKPENWLNVILKKSVIKN